MRFKCRESAIFSLLLVEHKIDQKSQHIETSALICSGNKLTGFYVVTTFPFNGLSYLWYFRCLKSKSIEENFEGVSLCILHVQKAHNSIVPYNTKKLYGTLINNIYSF